MGSESWYKPRDSVTVEFCFVHGDVDQHAASSTSQWTLTSNLRLGHITRNMEPNRNEQAESMIGKLLNWITLESTQMHNSYTYVVLTHFSHDHIQCTSHQVSLTPICQCHPTLSSCLSTFLLISTIQSRSHHIHADRGCAPPDHTASVSK